MKMLAMYVLVGLALPVRAGEGLDAIIARRQEMTRVARPAAQRMENGAIINVYDDGSIATSAVSVMRMSPATHAHIVRLADDKETLAAARAMAARVREINSAAASSLSDAAILGVAEEILDTSARDGSVGFGLGAALGAAAAAAATAKKKDKS